MCGISGVINFDQAIEYSTIHAFNQRLIHRGPDAQHVRLSADGSAALGHCRLAILDTSANADQPFRSSDDRYWLTFNGEIYNFLELKEELSALGFLFRTNSDTEVLLYAYIHWGEKCLNKLNGMWAFAIWDQKEKELFASRDRFGVKSLYFSHSTRRFMFASEQKAFFLFRGEGIGKICPKLAGAIVMYPESIESRRETLYTGIHKLLPGECLRFRKSGLSIKKWWSTFDETENASKDVTAGSLVKLFTQSCELRTRSDVKIATSLSGGLDSSAVTSQLAMFPKTVTEQQLKAFIGSFSNTTMDEYCWAKKVIEQYDLPSTRVTIDDGAVSSLIKSVLDLEDITSQPVLGPSFVYQAMKSEGFKVSIEGHAGDELLGGYTRHMNVYIADLLNKKNDPLSLSYAIAALGESWKGSDSAQKLRGNLLQLSLDPEATNLNLLNAKPYLSQYLKHEYVPLKHQVKERENPRYKSKDMLFQRLYEDLHYYSLPSILKVYDRLSMANSVEIRSPFLDYRFVLAALNANADLKINKGRSKSLLRDHFDFIPEKIRFRHDKKGFSHPLKVWLSKDLGMLVKDLVSHPRFLDSNLFDGVGLSQLLLGFLENKQYERVLMYWPLINLAILERFQS
ncbi:asparagine synthase (glutamine-hydrolyzing) [Alteromonas facilis]|uniref:asparagine synthase (glutamine-hydrolyzing) n=1 Tax=Alteromonas facilis TaxID=2048004 RepID=UPI000C28675D|nr:asparagine synthase (glutamine-hydrolyzing) [Alteromonas facilis]